jgi:acyl-CoA dehydrogenase
MPSLYFNSEHEMFRQSVKDFLRKEIKPHFSKWEADRQIPRWVWKKMGEMGYLGLCHEEKYGGTGADLFYSVVFLEELGRAGNGGLAAAIGVHSYIALNHISRAGSNALKEKYLRPGVEGKMIGALAITEPDAGSDVKKISTTAMSAGDDYIVNGSKTFITNGYYADFISTLVKTENGFSLLVIDGKSDGLSRRKLNKMGLHSSDTAELSFDDVRVPKSNIIGEEGHGFYYVMDSFQLERLVLAFSATGAMEETLRITLKYMNERQAFGRKISKLQVLRHKIAEMSTDIEACKQLVYHTTWLYSQGEFAVKEATMCKLKASELQKQVVDECLQMFGGYGYMEDYPIAQFYRDSRVGTIVGGTSDIMREIIAKMVIDSIEYDSQYTD